MLYIIIYTVYIYIYVCMTGLILHPQCPDQVHRNLTSAGFISTSSVLPVESSCGERFLVHPPKG